VSCGRRGGNAVRGGTDPGLAGDDWLRGGDGLASRPLASQRRADRFANLREQMSLEATLLTEQKTRKIIELLEELRRDSPEIPDREDLEANQMASKADPHEVMAVIEEVTNEKVVAVPEEH